MPVEFQRPVAVCQLVVSVLLWSLTGLIIKLIPWDGWSLGFGRGVVALLVMLVLIGHKLRSAHWLDVVMGACLAVNSTGFILASKWGPVANAIVLVYAAPIYSALFATLWKKEQFPWFNWLALFGVLTGIVLMVLDDLQSMSFRATIAGLVSGLALAAWVECRRYVNRDSGDRGLLFGAMITSACLWPWFAYSWSKGIDLRPVVLLGVVAYATIIVVAYMLFSRVVQYIPGATALLITGAEVPLMVAWVYFVTRELPTPRAMLGGVLIFIVTILTGFAATAKVNGAVEPVESAH